MNAQDLGDLKEFKNITATAEGVVIQFQDKGPRFNYQIDGLDRSVSKYGETVAVHFGQKAEFASRGLVVTFTPDQTEPQRFTIEKKIDLRSFGGDLKTETFSISVVSGQIIYGAKSGS